MPVAADLNTADPDAAPDSPGASSTPPAPAVPAGRPGGRPGLLVSVVVVALIAVVALGATVARLRSDNEALRARSRHHDEVAAVAGRFAAAVQAFDPAQPEAAVPLVEELGREPFISQYRSVLPTLTDLYRGVADLGGNAVRLEPTIKDLYLLTDDLDRQTASAIVVSDLVRTSGQDRTVLPDIVVKLDLAHLDGAWRVTNMTSMNVALGGADALGGTTVTPPETAP